LAAPHARPKPHSPGLRRRSGHLRAIGFQAVAPPRTHPSRSLDGPAADCRCQPEQTATEGGEAEAERSGSNRCTSATPGNRTQWGLSRGGMPSAT